MTIEHDAGDGPVPGAHDGEDEHFVPTGTMTILGIFVVTLILLWVSIYLILIARGVTV